MHEGKGVLAIGMLICATIFVTQSFAQNPECNGLEATHVGTENKDTIYGSSMDDVIVGLDGNDIIFGKGGRDVICGGSGNDVLYGNSGNDVLIGEGNLDTLDGGQGIDMCDASLEDKRARSCETEFEIHENIDNFQNQLNILRSQINEIISGIIMWSDIQEIPEDIADGDNDSFSKINCNSNQIIVFQEGFWTCKDFAEDSDMLRELNCNKEEIAKWNGELWECSRDVAFSVNPIFFHHFRLNGGEIFWAGVSGVSDGDLDKITIVFPTSGELSRLYAKLGDSGDITLPRIGEQYTLTIIKNKVEETVLQCIIPETVDFCISETKISVEAGDEILLKAESSSDAPFAIIKSSVLFEGS